MAEPFGAGTDMSRSVAAGWSGGSLAWSAAGPRTGVLAAVARMIHRTSSNVPTRLTAGQAATTAPTGPWDQPWATFAARVATIPSASRQRAMTGTAS